MLSRHGIVTTTQKSLGTGRFKNLLIVNVNLCEGSFEALVLASPCPAAAVRPLVPVSAALATISAVPAGGAGTPAPAVARPAIWVLPRAVTIFHAYLL